MPTPTFDGANRIILCPSVGYYDVVEDIYSDWKVWAKTGDHGKFPPAFDSIGGDDMGGGANVAPYVFIRNDLGWRLKAPEQTGDVIVQGNMLARDPDMGSFLLPADGAFTVTFRFEVSAIATILAVGSGVTAQDKLDISRRVWDENRSAHLSAGTFGQAVSKVDDVDNIIDGVLDAPTAQHGGTGTVGKAIGDIDGNIDQSLSETELGIRGVTGDNLDTLSDQLDVVQADLDNPDIYKANVSALATTAQLITVEANIRGADGDDLKGLSDQVDSTATSTELATTETNIRGADGDDLKDLSDQVDGLPTDDASAVAGAVWDEDKTGHTGSLKDVADNVDQSLSLTESNIRGPDGDDLKDLSDQVDNTATAAELATTETNIRGADGDDLKDLSDQVDGISVSVDPDEIATAVWAKEVPAVIPAGSYGEKMLLALGIGKHNMRMSNLSYSAEGKLQSGTIRIFRTAADTHNDVNPLKTYSVYAEYDGQGALTLYRCTEM